MTYFRKMKSLALAAIMELRHQYSVGFYPTDVASEEKWHKVQVKVNSPRGLGRLSLSYREGYQSFKK